MACSCFLCGWALLDGEGALLVYMYSGRLRRRMLPNRLRKHCLIDSRRTREHHAHPIRSGVRHTMLRKRNKRFPSSAWQLPMPPPHLPLSNIIKAKWGEVPTLHKTRSNPPYNPPGNVTSNCPPRPSHTWHQRVLSAPWPRALCRRRPCRVFGRYSEGIRGYSDGFRGIRLIWIA